MELPLAEHRHYIHVGSKYIFPPFMIPYLNLYALLSYTMDVAPQRLVYKRYCSAKQLIKANQVQRENLEVVNCPICSCQPKLPVVIVEF
ncbi:hypothetical protein T4B_14776 [Trichinella pseudospiralis]|uniref:Uncharacterized protein n=1 Tax=Trichinella pseudospiralis TaxID=6337 RepID=A0A0V1IA96_TRIPS|nr:hypothetical protein T4E_7367 [Trichinella pseudospiralis]KRZ19759.1 hypothetical protein T4B_14776 [Trichinella pseudospiralis]KRZ39284.1 hypothetical protein T4C_6215 [Trichinella pseudospiralis]